MLETDVLIGPAVKALRKRLGWTQGQLAAAADLRQSTISMIEIGTRKVGNAETTAKLAKAFGITMDDLVQLARAMAVGQVDISQYYNTARQRASDPRVIDVQAREVPQPGERAALPSSGQSSGAPPVAALDTVRAEVQAVPPELRDVLARLVTEYITAPDDRKDILREAIERLKGGGEYSRGHSAS